MSERGQSEPAQPGELRRRGRPRISAAVREENRRRFLAATEQAFARYGYYGVTVERVLEFEDLGRTQFYRAFPNVNEPIRILAGRYADDLVGALAEPLDRPGAQAEELLVEGLRAYVEHTLRRRHLLASYEAVLHDPNTPIRAAREDAVRRITALIRTALADLGRTPPGELEISTFLACAEFGCFRLAAAETVSGAAVQHVQRMLIRAATTFLGDPGSRSHPPAAPAPVPPATPLTG